jgi:hypothetical protein
MDDEKLKMMIDQYEIWRAVWGIENPTDILMTLNIALRDTNNPYIEQKAIDVAHRLKLAIAIAMNPLLTDDYLKNILLLTGTAIPEVVKVRELPPATM